MSVSLNIRRAPPRLRLPSDEGERHTTWLETFYDLMFAVAATALTERLGAHPTFVGAVQVTALFLPVWWAWLGHTVYDTRFDTGDLIQRLMTFVVMLAAAAMAAEIPVALESGSLGFAAAYVVARVVLLLLYYRAHHALPEARPVTRVYLIGFGLGAACWVVSLLTPPPVRFVLWAVGLAIDFATPWARRSVLQRSPVDTHHLPERLGLFTIIILGVTTLGIVTSVSFVNWQVVSVVAAILVFAMTVAFWWVYFLFLDAAPIEKRLGSGQPYMYMHLPIFLGLVFTSVGLERVIIEAPHAAFAMSTVWLIGVGTALWVLGVLGLKLITFTHYAQFELYLRYGLPLAGAALFVLVGERLPPLVAFGGLTAIFTCFTLIESRQWLRWLERRRVSKDTAATDSAAAATATDDGDKRQDGPPAGEQPQTDQPPGRTDPQPQKATRAK